MSGGGPGLRVRDGCARTGSKPGNLPDALLANADIRRDRNDRRKIAKTWHPKNGGSIEQAARALQNVSSDAEADVALLLGRAVLAWLMADGDCHLKNLAVLRVACDGAGNFSSVRLAPVYDAVTTRVFPSLETDQFALSLAGKRNRLSSRDFVRAGVTMGMNAGAARDIVSSLCGRLSAHLEDLEPNCERVNRAVEIWKERVTTMDRDR